MSLFQQAQGLIPSRIGFALTSPTGTDNSILPFIETSRLNMTPDNAGVICFVPLSSYGGTPLRAVKVTYSGDPKRAMFVLRTVVEQDGKAGTLTLGNTPALTDTGGAIFSVTFSINPQGLYTSSLRITASGETESGVYGLPNVRVYFVELLYSPNPIPLDIEPVGIVPGQVGTTLRW